MARPISRPSPNHPTPNISEQKGEKGPIQTGFLTFYSQSKMPGFAAMLNHWFPGNVTPEMVSTFVQNMTQMFAQALNRAKERHKKINDEIKRRIKEDN